LLQAENAFGIEFASYVHHETDEEQVSGYSRITRPPGYRRTEPPKTGRYNWRVRFLETGRGGDIFEYRKRTPAVG